MLVIFGFIYSDDFPPSQQDDPYGSVLSSSDAPVEEDFMNPESTLNRSATYESFDVIYFK